VFEQLAQSNAVPTNVYDALIVVVPATLAFLTSLVAAWAAIRGVVQNGRLQDDLTTVKTHVEAVREQSNAAAAVAQTVAVAAAVVAAEAAPSERPAPSNVTTTTLPPVATGGGGPTVHVPVVSTAIGP
jgi:hypothetical protein